MMSLLLHLFLIAGVMIKATNGEIQTWCVAKPSATEPELIADKEFCCNNGVDCSVINPGGACYDPNVLISHASVVMNTYYQNSGKNIWNCYFGKSGLITISDPSYGSCHYVTK